MDGRAAALAACGLPDALVHGDFHSGNLRGRLGEPLTVLDWTDTCIGPPLIDEVMFLDGRSTADAQLLREAWVGAWRRHVRGCDPERAAKFVEPVAALHFAVVYQRIRDAIEPDEWAYHADDAALWLRRAASAHTS
jgi:aminoglycoside phosphotransferase (APT) family kinase protein